jgi:DNA-directed RNA polymerase specialized sigma24 family protein
MAMRVALQGALRALTGRQRAVLVLRVYDDLPEAQVARHHTPQARPPFGEPPIPG